MKLPVEDDFNDILGKAQKGLDISTEALAAKSGVEPESVRNARKGDFDESVVAKLAQSMGLRPDPLATIGKNAWYPDQPDIGEGFALIATPFHDLHVNAFLVWNPSNQKCVAFDTGTDPKPMLAKIDALGLSLEALYLTHTHGDHIMGLGEIVGHHRCPVYVNKKELDRPAGAIAIEEGYSAPICGNALFIEAIETTGHTAGGTTYLITGLGMPLAIAGDAIFAGSMGGANVSYADCLKGLGRILALPDDTVIGSGHGPLTTVGQEKAMNPFFSDSSAS